MFRDLSDVRGSSLPEEFRSLSVRAFGATMDNGRIACGRFALSIIDHGAKAGRHRNACFYLACTGGDHSQALALKSSLVRRANGLARERGRVIDYGGPCTMAEDEVILSFARDVRPVVVLSEQLADSGTLHGLLYASSASPTGPITFVYYRNLHYCELQPTQPVTMEDLLNSVTLVDSMGARADSKHARARGRPPAPPRDNMQAPARPQQPTRLAAAFPAGLVMKFDGGARGNPGLAGAGARLALQSPGSAPPSVLAEASKFVGIAATNNVAELSGLVLGLDLALAFMRQEGPAAGGILVTIVGDTQLVIDVMRLEAVCNNEQLFALFAPSA